MSDTCQCPPCGKRQKLGLHALKLLPEDNVAKLASAFATKIFKSHDVLRHAVSPDWEEVLVERWTSLELEDRERFCRSISPDVPAEHRPDFLYLRHSARKDSIKSRAFDTPQINLEDLCNRTATLIEFIRSRAHCHPGEWIAIDAEDGGLKPASEHFKPKVWKSFMVCYGQDSTETYGALWPVERFTIEYNLHVADLPPLGLQALQIQTSLLKFLEDCCRKLLPEVEFDAVPAAPRAITPHQRIRDGSWMSTVHMNVDPSYLPTGQFRLDNLIYLAEGKIAECEDHIGTLISDPKYLLEMIRKSGEHCPKLEKEVFPRARFIMEVSEKGQDHPRWDDMRDVADRCTPTLKKLLGGRKHTARANPTALDRLFWARTSGWVLNHAHLNLLLWKRIGSSLKEVDRLLSNCKIKNGANCLPTDLELAFREFERFTSLLIDLSFASLDRAVVASPELRHLYEVTDQTAPGDTLTSSAKLIDRPLTHAEHRVHHTFHTLSTHLYGFHAPHAITDEVRNMMRTDTDAAALVSDFVATHTLAISIGQMFLRELSQFQPWASAFRFHYPWTSMVGAGQPLSKDMSNIINASLICGTEHPILAKAKNMQYPTEGKVSSQQAEQRILGIEQTCDELIHGFYNTLAETMGAEHPFITDLEELIGQFGPVERTQPIHSTNGEGTPSRASSSRKAKGKKARTPSQRSKAKLQASTTAQSSTSAPDFIHTARDRHAPKLPIPPPPPNEEAIQANPSIPLTFQKLFFATSASSPTPCLSFSDFTIAMESIGYEAFEMCWPGWLFSPKEAKKGEPKVVVKRPFWIRAPHANGGFFTLGEVRLLASRLKVALGIWEGAGLGGGLEEGLEGLDLEGEAEGEVEGEEIEGVDEGLEEVGEEGEGDDGEEGKEEMEMHEVVIEPVKTYCLPGGFLRLL